MLSYIMSVDQIKEMGLNPNKGKHVIKQSPTGERLRHPQVWRKVFMNGDDVGFFILSRK